MSSAVAPAASPSSPFWISVFLDFAPDEFDAGVMHWVLLTGYGLAAPRGEHREFATLVPNDGDPIVSDADAFLRVQRLGEEGESRIHLDLHVPDAGAAATHAESLGATIIADRGHWVMRSPGGFPFCFVTTPASRRPAPTGWRAGHHSLLDQVCLDIPDEHWTREQDFWSALTGWAFGTSRFPDSFRPLHRPEGHSVRLLLQHLGEPEGAVRAHLDWSTTDREAETERHLEAGSSIASINSVWSVLRGPGTVYCITDRNPSTGLLD